MAGEVVRLTRAGLAWRAAALLTGAALVTYGTVRGDDDLWPFAPMSQFAFAVDLDGQIRSTYVEALTSAGTRVRVPLSPGGVGIGRAEIEGQLPNIVAEPSKLQALAVAQARLHPELPAYEHLWLRQEVTQLRDGRESGRSDVLLAEWEVR